MVFAVRMTVFFDKPSVQKWIGKKNANALRLVGGTIRKIARNSIPRRKAIAAPGKPPSAHQGDIKRIIFALDPVTKSVIIGPIRVYKKRKNIGPVTVPNTLEKGGIVRQRTGRRGRIVRKRYRKHPYMEPALRKSLHLIPQAWRVSI